MFWKNDRVTISSFKNLSFGQVGGIYSELFESSFDGLNKCVRCGRFYDFLNKWA